MVAKELDKRLSKRERERVYIHVHVVVVLKNRYMTLMTH